MARRINQSDTGVKRAAAVGLIVVLVAAVGLSLAMFTRAFQSTVRIKVLSDRAGLVMDKDAKVRALGVEIGHVASISDELGGAVLDLDVDPKALGKIPSNSPVHIGSNTIFGAKTVDFDAPEQPSPTMLKAGATVRQTSVTTEVNTLFGNLTQLLAATEPDKLNATLGALSTALNGRGEELGETLSSLDQYLQTVNPEIDTLRRDLTKGAQVSQLYADVTPDVMRILDSGTDVGTTLVDHEQQFESLLATATSAGASGKKLLDTNGDQIIKLMQDLRKTTSLVAEYAPALNCMIIGLNQGVEQNGAAFGYGAQRGLAMRAGFQQGATPYKYPDDLPKVNASTGPHCYGLPFPDVNAHAPGLVADVGTNVLAGMPNTFAHENTDPLFGPLPPTQPGKPAPPTLLQLMLGQAPGAAR